MCVLHIYQKNGLILLLRNDFYKLFTILKVEEEWLIGKFTLFFYA